MKIALLGDIHANLRAFRAVLAHAAGHGADEIWNTGDLLGYGPAPNETAELARKCCAISVMGNVDAAILGMQPAEIPSARALCGLPPKEFMRAWTARELGKKNAAFLSALPQQARARKNGIRFLVVHGSPDSNKEKISQLTPRSRLRRIAAEAEYDVLVCGHAHIPFAEQIAGVRFVNTGSVGRPDDGDTRACYAMAEISPGGRLSVEHYRVAYGVAAVVAEMRKKRFPPALRRMIRLGVSLEAVLAQSHEPRLGAIPDEEAAAFAERMGADMAHCRHVRALAFQLFDALAPLHGMAGRQRALLSCAAWLHDIGWCEGKKDHHKASLRLIMSQRAPAWPPSERKLLACVARYHRGATPKNTHPIYPELKAAEKRDVRLCGAILRLADGFDATHTGAVREISAGTSAGEIALRCRTSGPAEEDFAAAREKGEWLQRLLKRKIRIRARH